MEAYWLKHSDSLNGEFFSEVMQPKSLHGGASRVIRSPRRRSENVGEGKQTI